VVNTVVAYLSSIFLYPVKSLDGVSVNSARVLPTGALADDRRFAIFDGLDQYVNGKRNPRVHLLRSSYDPASHRLTLAVGADGSPRTFDIFSQREALETWLSEFFGFQVSFRQKADIGFPDDTDSPGPTLISTATLREVADWFGLTLDQTRARFRTNLEVDGVPPFWEDQLYGQKGVTVRFRIGDVLLDGINPCQRCVVPARDPLTAQSVADFAKRFVELRRKFLPDWAESSRFNHYYRLAINTRLVSDKPIQSINVGDPIEIIGPVGSPQTAVAAAPAKPSRWSGRLRVAGVSETTPTVSTFRLAPIDEDKLPFTYLPGQYLNIEVMIDGILHRRCYTIASAPTNPDYCELTIKREETGMVSRHLHDFIQDGVELNVSGPSGRFTFTGSEADSLLLIGAGVGITPLMSVIRYLTHQNWPGSIHLLYCAKSQREIIFKEELQSLSKIFPNLRITITLTQEPNGCWPGRRGRITRELLQSVLPDSPKRRIHICGPLEMANHTKQMLHDARVPPEQIFSEAFGGPIPKSNGAANGNGNGRVVGSVTFANSGKSAPFHAGETVLDAAASVAIPIDRGCLAGICGRCKVRLLSGNVEMDEHEGLCDIDRENGFVLACQAKPLGSVAIEA
jgi:ferredoxin-NADP reductase/uncharacterized protein YcbX